MGSPASTNIFNQDINEVYNGNFEVKKVREFYTLGHLLSRYRDVKEFAETVKENERLYDFLTWNFEKGGFWGKLKDFQPDLLVLDLFAEVYFGSLRLPNGSVVTRNFRLMDSDPKNADIFNASTPGYIDKVIDQVETFQKKVLEISPKTVLIFNGARFPKKMSKNGVIQEEYDPKKYKLSTHDIKRYNKIWRALDNALINKNFEVLQFDQKNSAAEVNFPTGKQWYYLYNQNYYTDVQSQIEMVAQKYGLGPKIVTLDLDSDPDISESDPDVVFLNVPNEKNDLKVFKEDKNARKQALKIAQQDYVLHGNRGSSYRFIKRTELKTKFPKFKDLHYRLIPPKEDKKYWGNKLLVRMFGFSLPHKTSVIQRNFRLDFKTLKDSIVKDTYILEIGDINLIAGSFYANTPNYPDYEEQVQELIKCIANEYNIDNDSIITYGTSRGATGAVLHGALGNYKFVAADPAINDMPWYVDSDAHYVEGVREIDYTDKVANALNNYTRNKCDGIVLAASKVGATFSSHLRLPLEKITLIDMNLDLYQHSKINGKSVPIQLGYINSLLIKDNVSVITSDDDLTTGVLLEIKHLANDAINFEKITKFRISVTDVQNSDKETYECAMQNIQGKYNCVHSDTDFKYFEMI